MIREFAAYLFQFFGDAFGKLFAFLGSLFSGLFEGLKSLLVFIFEPILALIGSIFYFLQKLGGLILLLIEVLWKFIVFFVSIMKGLFVTLIGLSYNGSAAVIPSRYQEVFNHLAPALQMAQMDKIATLCLWAVWIFIAIAAVKVIGARS